MRDEETKEFSFKKDNEGELVEQAIKRLSLDENSDAI